MSPTAAAPDYAVDAILDLQESAPSSYWSRIMECARRLDGRLDAWRLGVRVADTPDAAQELPHLLAHLGIVGLDHEITRDGAGSQALTLTRRR